MTIVAEVVSAFLQEELRHDAVPQMTVLALFLLYDCVHIFHPKIGGRKFGMTLQTILANKFLLCGRPGCGIQDDAQGNNRSKSADPLFCKCGPHRYLLIISFTLLFCHV